MYADKITDSMDQAIKETRRRRSIQMAYNEEHGIVPQTVKKGLSDITDYLESEEGKRSAQEVNADLAGYSRSEILRVIASLEDEMMEASAAMDFERAASARDQIVQLRGQMEGKSEEAVLGELKKTARKGSAFGARKSSYGGGRKS